MNLLAKSLASGVIVVGGVLAMGGVAFAASTPPPPPPPPPSTCPTSLTSCESLLAYVNSRSFGEPIKAGESGTVYYEDETALGTKNLAPSLTLSYQNSHGKTKTISVTVTATTLFSGTALTTSETSLTASFSAYNPEYGGSGPNAASQTGAPGQYPFISKITYTLPKSLSNSVSYKATLHVWDGDGNQDQISWTFMPANGTPIAPLFGSDPVAVAGALMVAAGGLTAVVYRRRNRSALSS
jgi:hypothetical protein